MAIRAATYLAAMLVASLAAAVLAAALFGLGAAVARAQAPACYAAGASIDVAGDLSAWAAYNVTSVPALLAVPAVSPVGYLAVENGTTPLPASFNGTDILVAVDEPGVVNVSYLTLSATSKAGALWQASFTMPCEGWVYLPPGSAPVQVSPLPVQVKYVDDMPALLLPEGPITIEYMLSVTTTTTVVPTTTTTVTTPVTTVVTTPTTTHTTVVTATTVTPTTTVSTTTSVPPVVAPLEVGVVGAVVVVAAVGAYLALSRRGGGRWAESLDDRDVAILDALAKMGGEATASDLISATGIPKTPMYRRLAKLVRLGYLEEGTRGGVKVYRCKRPGCR